VRQWPDGAAGVKSGAACGLAATSEQVWTLRAPHWQRPRAFEVAP